MGFFEALQKHRLFVHYLTVVILIVGILSFTGLRREARPNVNFNRVAVGISYPGASPSDVEELLIDPIEEKIGEVDGVEEYRSVSYSGAGAISIQIDDEYPNPGEIVDELRRKIGETKGLPSEATEPFIMEIKASTIPIISLAIFGNLEPFQLKLEVEKLKDYLTQFEGVQSVSYSGLEDLQLKILTDPKSLEVNDLTLLELISGLSKWSKKRPGGLLENNEFSANLTVGKEYNTKELLKNFVIRSNDAFKSIELSKVARIEYDLKNLQKINLYGGENAVLVTVTKKPNADIIQTVDRIKSGLDTYVKGFPSNLKYTVYNDQSTRVRDRLSTVSKNALFGLLLVIVLLILFLDWRSAIVTSVGIPVALLGGIVIIFLLGNTLNTLVLIGMIIVLGMLVDDAIVVCENIYSHIENGLSSREAALRGVKQIAIPVTATVLTTVFAFFPILFMKEIIGQFLRIIPLTVIAMLLVSLFEALVILPVHSSELMKPRAKRQNIFSSLESRYSKYVEWSIQHRKIIVFILVTIFVASALLGQKQFSKFTLFPARGLQGFSMRVELPKNSPLEKTSNAVKELSNELEQVSRNSFEGMFAAIGEVRTGGRSGSRQNASHLGMIEIEFISDDDFIKIEDEVMRDIRRVGQEWSKKTGYKTSITIDRPGPPVGKPIQIQIASRDFQKGGILADEFKSKLNQIDGVHSVETDLDGDTKTYTYQINDLFAVSSGVNPEDIAKTIFSATSGVVANEVLINNEKVDLLVGVDHQGMWKSEDILGLRVQGAGGVPIPIRAFTKVQEDFGPSSIQRLNGLRTISIFGEVDENIITGKEANQLIQPLIEKLQSENPTIRIEKGGGERDRVRALSDTAKLYLLAVIMIFMTISLAFQSILYPFLVLLSIPMGLVGVVWALAAHGMELSLMSLIGIVGLSGVVVNVSIILMSYLKERLQDGETLHDAIVQAAVRRLRPIIITTITTLVGLIPLMYGFGGTDTFVQPLALSLGWGLAGATTLTLFAFPALLSLASRLKPSNNHK